MVLGAPGDYSNCLNRTFFLSSAIFQSGPHGCSDNHRRIEMHDQELKELKHDPVPGYRPAFYVIFGISLIYMIIIFLKAY